MGSLGHRCPSLVVDSIDVLDSLLEVEGVSKSSSDDCALEHVEDVGLLVVLGETDCVGVLGVEGILGEAAAGGRMWGLLAFVR